MDLTIENQVQGINVWSFLIIKLYFFPKSYYIQSLLYKNLASLHFKYENLDVIGI